MLLEIKNLRVGFATDTEAVKGINLLVGENEVLGLVGESGCGKTVTALSVMGILPVNAEIKSGQILFESKDLLKLSQPEMREIRGKEIGMIFQEPFTSLNPVIKIGEQIEEAISAHKDISKKDSLALTFELLAKVRLDKRIYHDYPHQLSGGQRQRVLIAMALAHKPKLLIADEPTTALDVTTQSEILKLILELKKDMQMSVLFITHDLGIINEVADKVAVMKDGVIVERGKKDIIMHLPQYPYTRKLLNAVPKLKSASAKPREIPSKEVLIKARSISKSFSVERGIFKKESGKIEAVKNVDLTIKKGESLGLVGESGCGKTTLGRILIGLIEPDTGSVEIAGKDLKAQLKNTPYEVRKMMQIVFQDPYGSLDPRMKMGQIVLEGPAIMDKSGSEKLSILKNILLKVHLNYEDRNKYPHQFSGGQRQRIAIARALATDAKFLILDEPVSSLDVLIQKDILDLLQFLRKKLNLTYLFISHDLRVVEAMSDKIAVMHNGEIVELAPASEIYKSPKHPYTQHLLSSIPKLS